MAKRPLFLGVYAEYGNVVGLALGADILNLFKLRIPVFDIFQSQCFDKGALLEASCLLHLFDGISGHSDALFLEQPDNLRCGYGQPNDIFVLGQPRCIQGSYLAENIKNEK